MPPSPMAQSPAPTEAVSRLAVAQKEAPAGAARPQAAQGFAGTLDELLAQTATDAPSAQPQIASKVGPATTADTPALDGTQQPPQVAVPLGQEPGTLPSPSKVVALLNPPSSADPKRAGATDKRPAGSSASSATSAEPATGLPDQAPTQPIPAPPVAPVTLPIPPAGTAPSAHPTTPSNWPAQSQQEATSHTTTRVDARLSGNATRFTAAAQADAAVHPASAEAAASANSAAAAPQPSTIAAPSPMSNLAVSALTAAGLAPHAAALPQDPVPAARSQPAPPPPSLQVAEAVAGPVQLSLTSSSRSGGAQTLTVALKPAELGRVEVQIQRPADGPAKIVPRRRAAGHPASPGRRGAPSSAGTRSRRHPR